MCSHNPQSRGCGQCQRIRARDESHRELLSYDAAGTIVARPTLLIHHKITPQGHRPYPRRLRIRYRRLLLHLLLTAGIINRQFIRGDFIHPLAMLRGNTMRFWQRHYRLGQQSQGKQEQSNEEMKLRHH